MRRIPILVLPLVFLFFPPTTHAFIPEVIEQSSLHDITRIEEPEQARVFYGVLNDFPHTYEIRATEKFHFFAEMWVPEISTAENVVSVIVIREVGEKGRVKEVSRILAKDATWGSFYEPILGDRYRKGGVFETDLDPGVYRIEVSTPNNLEPYALVIGTKDSLFPVGYFNMLGRIADVKIFFGKSTLSVVQSRYVYIPLLVLGLLAVVYWIIRRRTTMST